MPRQPLIICGDHLNSVIAELFTRQVQLAAQIAMSRVAKLIRTAHQRFLDSRLHETVSTLEYAQRLSPSHLGISLLLGYVRLQADIPSATEPLEFLLRLQSSKDAWLCLAAARLQAGDVDQAERELYQGLSRHSPPDSHWGQILSTTIVKQAGAPGWCSLGPEGILLLGGDAAKATRRRLSITINGDPLAFRGSKKANAPLPHNPTRAVLLQSAWEKAALIEVALDGVALLGSPLQTQCVTEVSGFVSAETGIVSGWCWYPHAEGHPVRLSLEDASSGAKFGEVYAVEPLYDPESFSALDRPLRFQVPLHALAQNLDLMCVVGPRRLKLTGNPVDPFGEQQSAIAASDAVAVRYPSVTNPPNPALPRQPSAPAAVRGRLQSKYCDDCKPPVDVIIPIYRGREVTLKAIACALSADESLGKIIVVSDACPDAELLHELELLALKGKIVLHKEPLNLGFPGAANAGLRLAGNSDAVLLNSDAFVTPHWLSRLQRTAYSAPDIGSVTPISNDATIFSYPSADQENPLPSEQQSHEISAAAWAINADVVIDVPTAHGFCMFIRRACLDDIGLFREDLFGQGYGEENDFSIRASNKGWRNVVTPSVYVAHVGGQSFAATRKHLIKRNISIVNRLHPGYDRMVQDWLRADPLAQSRRRLDLEMLRRWRCPDSELVLFMTHNRGGGVARHVHERMLTLSMSGTQVAVLRPGKALYTVDLRYGISEAGHNLIYQFPDELRSFTAAYELLNPCRIEIHHIMDFHSKLIEDIRLSGTPYSIFVHDFHWYCPRTNLTKGKAKYCGEPPAEFCRQCIRAEGADFQSPVDPVELQAASRFLMEGAVEITAPSIDTALRIARRLRVLPAVRPWEEVQRLPQAPTIRASPDAILRVCIVGAIGWEKGYGILLEMAQIIAYEKLPVELRLVGYTCDDERFGAFDCVKVTGRYEEAEINELVARQQAHIGFLPAVWPETWSYTLTAMWAAGLYVAAFDIGAPAERIRESRGHLFPMTSSPRDILQDLLQITI